jgi:hypothetical protein
LKRERPFQDSLFCQLIFALTAYESFKEWNSNSEIADAAEKLYGDINHLELYVGLQAEETKPLVEGAGLCPGSLSIQF